MDYYIGGHQDHFGSDFVIQYIGRSPASCHWDLLGIIIKMIGQKCDLERGGETQDHQDTLGVSIPGYPLPGDTT